MRRTTRTGQHGLLAAFAVISLTSELPARVGGGQGEELHRFDGLAALDHLGYSVAGAGDVDGDGFDDLIVGAPTADPGGLNSAGSAYVYSGASGALIWQFDGLAPGDDLGWSVSGAGDVDGDGHDDLVVGARDALSLAGVARIYSGATGTLIRQFHGGPLDHLGISVSGAGDVDGDGIDDQIVGAEWADPGGLNQAGSAYVYSGASGALIWQFDGAIALELLGGSVSGAGDVDGDGHADLIVGAVGAAPGGLVDAGSAYVYSGASGALLWRFDGAAGNDWLGWSVSGAGDVDGDGLDDLIVGAFFASPGGLFWAGSAYVYSGATGALLWQFDGVAAEDWLGSSVSGAGDVDGDGFDDLVVGARFAHWGGLPDVGAAYVYSGASGSLLWQLHGAATDDRLGSSVSGAGDVDGDGLGDVIVGASDADPGGLSGAGKAFVHSFDPFEPVDFCAGDDTGTACPCGNTGGPASGCANSGGAGATLSASGSASVAADDLELDASQLLAGQPALLFVGVNAVNGGDGVQFGDGLRCAGGSVVRLGTRIPDAAGAASWGPGLGALGGWVAGDLRRFQCWYRDPAGPCGFGFNLTNGVEVTFTP